MYFSNISKEEFKEFSDHSSMKTFMQTEEVAMLREKNGCKSHFVGVKKDDILVAAAMLLSKRRHFGRYEFYSPRGFLLDYNDFLLLDFFTQEMKKYVKKNKGYMFRIDPYIINVERDGNGNILENGIDHSAIKKHLFQLGYKCIPKEKREQVSWMYVLDIDGKSEDEVFKNMKQNTRNIIRKTLKHGIEIQELSKSELKEFYKIMEDTGKRKGFAIRNLQYYENMYDAFYDKGEIKYLVAKLDLDKQIKVLSEEVDCCLKEKEKLGGNKHHEGKIKSLDEQVQGLLKTIKMAEEIRKRDGNIITLSGSQFMLVQPEVIYLSSGNYEEYLFYNSQYLIQWEMIKYAVKNGFKRYNFYGITGNFDPNDKDYGIYKFKTGFNGYCEELIGEYVMPVSFHYYLLDFLMRFKK